METLKWQTKNTVNVPIHVIVLSVGMPKYTQLVHKANVTNFDRRYRNLPETILGLTL